MKPELQNKLYTDFPKLYRQKDLPMTESCMVFGFECSEGWYELLYDLSKQLTFLADKFNIEIEAVQVKEKFGTLRFYYNTSNDWDDTIYDIIQACISKAEKESAYTCEECGKFGQQRGTMWIYTACDEHTKDYDKEDETIEKLYTIKYNSKDKTFIAYSLKHDFLSAYGATAQKALEELEKVINIIND